jgi:hypothetical protein
LASFGDRIDDFPGGSEIQADNSCTNDKKGAWKFEPDPSTMAAIKPTYILAPNWDINDAHG